MAAAFKKAPKINDLFRSALMKKMRQKNADECDVNNEDPDALLKKELEEAKRIKMEAAKVKK